MVREIQRYDDERDEYRGEPQESEQVLHLRALHFPKDSTQKATLAGGFLFLN